MAEEKDLSQQRIIMWKGVVAWRYVDAFGTHFTEDFKEIEGNPEVLEWTPLKAAEQERDPNALLSRYEDALRFIAENGFAMKDWHFAQLILNGCSVEDAKAKVRDFNNPTAEGL